MCVDHAPIMFAGKCSGGLTHDISCPQLRQGEIHASTEVAAELAAPGGPMEVQLFGYALLQHLVRRHCATKMISLPLLRPEIFARQARVMLQVGNRWAEYSAQEHAQLASLALDMLNRGEDSAVQTFQGIQNCHLITMLRI